MSDHDAAHDPDPELEPQPEIDEAIIAQVSDYLDGALAGADRLSVGHGPGPVDHFASRRDA